MSLTAEDLTQIRTIVREEMKPLQDEIQAIRNDIKEIYDRLDKIERKITPDKEFETLNLEQKLLRINGELLAAAKEAGVTLPRE